MAKIDKKLQKAFRLAGFDAGQTAEKKKKEFAKKIVEKATDGGVPNKLTRKQYTKKYGGDGYRAYKGT